MVNVMMEFRRELRVAERAHRQLTGNPVSLVASFDEFMVSLFVRIRDKMREFIRQWVQELRNVWDDINNPLDISVLALAATLQNAANNIAIDQTDFYQQV
jgi:deoxyribodipyrimidine photolyase